MIELIKISVSIIPVFVFLITLIFLDSFKLVRVRSILETILAGCIVAILCLFLNKFLLENFNIDLVLYARYLSPIIEELFKAIFIIYLIKINKVGFLVDGAIYGFAVGAGFAFVENIYYLQSLQNSNILLWIIRGFGTAVMHGGTTAIFAILSKTLYDRYISNKIHYFLFGLIVAITIHSFFNHFLLPPLIITFMQLIILPVIIILIYTHSEKALRDWLEVGFDVDVWMLEQITTGNFSKTKIGTYLLSLKSKFTGEIVADMLCLLRIHLELAIRAKGILLMQEAGFPITSDPEIKEKFTELIFLEKNIGKTGELAISPILHTSTHELWQLYLIDNK